MRGPPSGGIRSIEPSATVTGSAANTAAQNGRMRSASKVSTAISARCGRTDCAMAPNPAASAEICLASIRSRSVTPPSECVLSSNDTVRQRMSMSGW